MRFLTAADIQKSYIRGGSKMAKKKSVKMEKKAKVSIREEIKTLARNIDESRYDLYLKLYEVKEKEQYASWGYENYKDYVEEELSLEYRIALWYARMGEIITKYNIPKDVILNVSWTKFKEISLLDNKEEIEKLLKKAPNMTFQEIKDVVKQLRKNIAPKKEINITKITFNLIEDQYDVVKQAIEKAKQTVGTDSNGAALEYICQEFLMADEPIEEEEWEEVEFDDDEEE